jgi:hypothetical protein
MTGAFKEKLWPFGARIFGFGEWCRSSAFGEGAGLLNPVTEPKRSQNPKRPPAPFPAEGPQFFFNRSNPATSLCQRSLCVLACLFALTAPADPETNTVFIARAESVFHRTQQLFQADPTNATNAWQFASACTDLADLATNDARHAEIARLGIAACQQLIARDSKSAPGHYYLGMNYGELAQAEAPSVAAYKLVREMEHEFKLAVALDEKFDYAGPVRCLGLLYRDAPGWPVSIGSKRKARELLDHAAALFPDYPENQLNLAESHLQWHQHNEAGKALNKLDAIWNPARTNLTGELWEKSWSDWTNRRAAAKAELGDGNKSR